MLPNRFVAALFATLFVAQLFAGLASAQGLPASSGVDLIIEDIDVGRPRVVGVPAPINITIRNQGTENFPGTTGWQIFVGLNGRQESSCIEPGDNSVAVTPASPCYIRLSPGGQQNPSIDAGTSRTYTMMWNAATNQASPNATVFVIIETLGDQRHDDVCDGPDGANCANNWREVVISVGQLGVRAVPQRAISSAPGAKINSPWTTEEITERCPTSPNVVTRGCKVLPGTTVVASYMVTNLGTVTDSYVGTALGVSGRNNLLERGFVFSFAPETVSLPPRAQREVRVSIFVPENATANDKINVDSVMNRTVRWTSTLNPAVTTADPGNLECDKADIQDQDICRDPTMPSLIIDFRRGLNATSNETWKQVFAGRPATFNITLNNTGNAVDLYNISFDNTSRTINDSWSPTILNPGFINTTALVNATIQVTPPRNATNTSYTFDVILKSRGDIEGDAPCKVNERPSRGECRMTLTAHLAQEWNMAGASDVPARTVPGETVTYNLGIINHGNGYDNVSLELQSTVFGGWDVRLSNTTVRLTPFNTTTFSLSVTSPPNTPEGTEAAFFVNATAGGPIETPFDARSKATIMSRLTILRGPNIRIDAPVNSSFIDAGATAEYDLLVTNVGNVADNFTLALERQHPDWSATATPTFLELQPNEQGTVRVTVRAPSGALVGERSNVFVNVKSSVDASRTKQTTLEGRVSGPDLFVDNILVNSTNPYSGDPLELSVVLGNAGNKAPDRNTTLRVYFVQNGVERVIGEKLYEPNMIPGQRRLSERFLWDTSGVEGAGVLLARIDVGDLVREIDDSAASNERTRAITLRTFDIRVIPAEGLTGRPGERVTYGEAPNVFLVEYRGNQPNEPVTIRFESEHGWLLNVDGERVPQLELSLSLVRGSAIPVVANLEIPQLPGTGEDRLTMSVIPGLRPGATISASTRTSVIDEERPRIVRIATTPESARIGDSVAVDVFVEDATGVASVVAYVLAPTNETTRLVLTESAPGRWSGTQSVALAGRYVFSAEAIDAADPPNRNSTRSTTATVAVTPGSVPTIRLAEGQSTTIRSGSFIKLDIHDPLGIGRATYNIRGVTYDLRGPDHQIDTSSFQAGPIDITVTAENIYGVSSSQKFSFVVDNAPPGITRVTMTPDRPKANEDVTLTIQTEAKVEAVDVLIKRDGQVVQSLNATRRGVGSFELKFNPGEGDYTIDVTARDAAGNTRLSEGAVKFSAKPGSPFEVPGLGLGALLGALVVVALLGRRR